MSKYYVLAKDTRRNWAIYSEPGISFLEQSSRSFTDLEIDLVYQLVTNYFHYDKVGINRRISYVITTGFSYHDAINFVSDLLRIQAKDLKRVKHKYVRQHTVKYSIISKDKALKITKSLPLKRYKNDGEAALIKHNSIEERRWNNHYKKNLHSIYK